jgi:transposase
MENQTALILTRMWMAGETAEAIGNRFGVSASTAYKMAARYKLPARPTRPCQVSRDPSPDEIERMKAELKAKHIAERMAEDVSNTQSKVSKWRRGIFQPRGVA